MCIVLNSLKADYSTETIQTYKVYSIENRVLESPWNKSSLNGTIHQPGTYYCSKLTKFNIVLFSDEISVNISDLHKHLNKNVDIGGFHSFVFKEHAILYKKYLQSLFHKNSYRIVPITVGVNDIFAQGYTEIASYNFAEINQKAPTVVSTKITISQESFRESFTCV